MKWFVAISGNIGSGASEGKTRSNVMDEARRKYTRALGVHGDDKMLNRDESPQ